MRRSECLVRPCLSCYVALMDPFLHMITVLAALALLLAAIIWARVWKRPSIEGLKPAAGLTMGAFVLLAASLLIGAFTQ